MIPAQKYIIESYDDQMHMFGYRRSEHYYIEQYKIIIIVRENNANDININSIDVVDSVEPKNKYFIAHEFKIAQICQIDLPVDFVRRSLILKEYKKQSIEIMKDIVNTSIVVDCDMHYKEFDMGVKTFKMNNDKTESIQYFMNALVYKNKDTDTLYNLACCYAYTDVKMAIDYLMMAVVNGFIHLDTIKSDHDLDVLRKLPIFNDIVIGLQEFNKSYRELYEILEGYTTDDEKIYHINKSLDLLENSIKYIKFNPQFLESFAGFTKIKNNDRFKRIVASF